MRVLWLLGVIGICVTSASANVATWNSTKSGNWNTASNWVGGVLPVAGDSAVIPSGTGIPTANADLGLADVQVDSGATLKISNSLATTGSVTLNGGTVYMNNGCTLAAPVHLMANSTFATNIGYANSTETISNTISELSPGLKVTYDGEPHLSGGYLDTIAPTGTNTYTGGTDIYGPKVAAKNANSLGTGAVNVYSGMLSLLYSGSYNFGTINGRGTYVSPGSTGSIAWAPGLVQFESGYNPTNLTINMQGGAISGLASATIGSTNSISISGTVGILSNPGTSNINSPLTVNTTITGSGKAVLGDWGTPTWNSGTSKWVTPNINRTQFNAAQSWTGGTDVRGLVDLNAGATLPAGTITVYGIDNSIGYKNGELRLLNTASNGGLSTLSDLVLVDQTFNSGTNTLSAYASLRLGTNITVHSLMLNGSYLPAGYYVATGGTYAGATVLPNNLYSASNAYYLHVIASTPEPATLALLSLAGVGIVIRRRR